MKNDVSYVIGIEDPRTLRKEILLGAKGMLSVLRSKSRLKEMVDLREEKVRQLRSHILEMNELLSSLHKQFPEKEVPDGIKSYTPKPSSPLLDLPYIGPSRLSDLNELGIITIEDLAYAPVDLLLKKFSEGIASRLQSEAREFIGVVVEQEPESVDEVEDSSLSDIDILEQKLAAIESKLNNL